MNPRAAINDLLPFQGSPFSLLGTSPKIADLNFYGTIRFCGEGISSGEGGIRTHAPLRTNGFQDRLVMTTSIPLHVVRLSFSASVILANKISSVNNFFNFFLINLSKAEIKQVFRQKNVFRCRYFDVLIRTFHQLYLFTGQCLYHHCIIRDRDLTCCKFLFP